MTDVNRGKQRIAPLQIPLGLDVTRDISGALDATAAELFALSENRFRFPDDALARGFFLLRLTDDEATSSSTSVKLSTAESTCDSLMTNGGAKRIVLRCISVVSTLLKKLIADTDVQFSESFEVDGQEMFKHACGVGLEGVVSKVQDSR
jgi:hypothetical protein